MALTGDYDSSAFSTISLQDSEPKVESPCEPCHRDGLNRDATGFCVDCDETLCDECRDSHRKIKSLLSHVVKDKSEIGGVEAEPSDKPRPPSPEAISNRCLEHGGRAVQFFCTTCCVICCDECVSENHKDCGATAVPDVSRFIADVDNPDLAGELGKVAKGFQDIGRRLESNVNESEKSLSDVTDIVKSLFEDIITTLEALFNEIEKILSEMKEEYKSSCDSVIAKAKEAENKASDVRSTADTLKRNDNNQDIMRSIRTINSLLPGLTTGLNLGENGSQKNYLASLRKIQTFMETLRSFGESNESHDQAIPGSQLTNLSLETAADRDTCRVTGAIVTSGWLMVADRGNKKVKVIDNEQKKLVTELSFPALFP